MSRDYSAYNSAMSNPIALFVTCLVDQVLPEVGIATVRLLRRAGYTVEFPPGQTCCGQPFFNSGFSDEARRLAKRTIEIFEPYSAVVLPSGSCTTMVRLEYLHLFEDEPEWKARAEALAQKIFEISEFLIVHETLPQTNSGEVLPVGVTYHDSCHMCRLLGLKDEPRKALTKTGARLIEMPESDRCCGFGGLFSVKMPEISQAITSRKVNEAAETRAEILVSADPGCLMQMRQAGKDGEMRIEHIAVILEERTR